jgi:vitamin B12 transporter
MKKNLRGRIQRPTVVCLFLVFSLPAIAAGGASIHGTVKDSLGAVVAGASIELLQNQALLGKTKTDAEGNYTIRVPGPGRYQVRASRASFRSALSGSVYVSATGEARMDLILSPGVLAEQVTVTATGAPTPEAQLGSAVTVVEQRQYPFALNMQEPLQLIPGLQIIQSGEAGSAASLYIRGGDSDSSKVLIDGLPASFIGGTTNFATDPAAGVGQIEVLRGPNSELYGSDALAGVVSMTTQRGSTRFPEITYAADGGNFGTSHQEGALGGAYRQFDYFSDFAVLNTQNSQPDDSFHQATYAGNFGWSPKSGTSLRITLRHVFNHGAIPNAIQLYGIPDAAGQTEKDLYAGATFENQTTARWHNLIRYGRVRLRQLYTDYAPTGIPYDAFGEGYPSWYIGAPVTLHGANGYSVNGQAIFQYPGIYPSLSTSTTNRDFVYAQSDYRFSPHLTALFGFKYENERGESDSTGYASQAVARGNYSYTMQLAGDFFNRLYYTLGSGIENNAVFGVEATPRASLAYYLIRPGSSRWFSGTRLRASFARGIKEPSLYQQLSSLHDLLLQSGEGDLVSQFGIGPVGAERSRTYDGGLDQNFARSRGRLGLTYFHNEFSGGVEYVPEQGLVALGIPTAVAQAVPYGAYINSLTYRAEGAETEVEYKLGRGLLASGGYTYLDAVVQRSFSSDALAPSFNPAFPNVPIGVYSPLVGARPFRRAPHSGYFQLSYDQSRWIASFTATFVGRRDDSDFLYDKDGGNTLLLPNRNLDAAYQRLDLSGGFRINRFVQIYSAMQNLLSQHYAEAFGYPALPFTLRAGIKLTFGGQSWK